MVGLSRTVRGEELTEYELIVIRERGDRLVYIAHPSGQPSAEFLSTTIARTTVVFENPAHDFPQRIGYRREAGSLLAWSRRLSRQLRQPWAARVQTKANSPTSAMLRQRQITTCSTRASAAKRSAAALAGTLGSAPYRSARSPRTCDQWRR